MFYVIGISCSYNLLLCQAKVWKYHLIQHLLEDNIKALMFLCSFHNLIELKCYEEVLYLHHIRNEIQGHK